MSDVVEARSAVLAGEVEKYFLASRMFFQKLCEVVDFAVQNDPKIIAIIVAFDFFSRVLLRHFYLLCL
jgi:hypothetical protein